MKKDTKKNTALKPRVDGEGPRKASGPRARQPWLPSSAEEAATIDRMVAEMRRSVDARVGPAATYEERRDATTTLMAKVMWRSEDNDIQEKAEGEGEVEDDDGIRYRALSQRSSTMCFGRWGSHVVVEPLYRQVGVRNGPTLKPIELRLGLVQGMTPDFARMIGELSGEQSSREVVRTLEVFGFASPSRAFVEKRVKAMAVEVAANVVELEEAARATEPVLEEVASISCGLDRMSVRMTEKVPEAEAESTPRPRRTEAYQRTPPPPKVYRFRKAWVGSVTMYDRTGAELRTMRFAGEPETEPEALAERVAADVVKLLALEPATPIHVVQDAAPEPRALPEVLRRALPVDTRVVDLVDFEHLAGYLDAVVDAVEPKGDPHDIKSWSRQELLRDDGAIDRIFAKLRRQARALRSAPAGAERGRDARDALAKAIRYIRTRKEKMRYASHYRARLPIGSGATESTCWTMQRRVKRPGQSWLAPGLDAVLALRAMVLSERWRPAWKTYASRFRREIRAVA